MASDQVPAGGEDFQPQLSGKVPAAVNEGLDMLGCDLAAAESSF
jgi:hypothetical protein